VYQFRRFARVLIRLAINEEYEPAVKANR